MGRMNLAQTTQFKKDVKRMQKRGKDLGIAVTAALLTFSSIELWIKVKVLPLI